MHPLLLPGTHPLRRGDDHLQVGLGHAAVLPGPVRRLGEVQPDAAVLTALVRRGLALPDDRPLRAALPPECPDEPAHPWVRHSLAALARRTGAGLSTALAQRTRHRVEVHAFGHPAGRPLAEDLLGLCRRAGLAAGRPRRRRSSARTGRPSIHDAALPVLLGVGEPTRDRLDGWIREGRPHLVVRLVEGSAVVGPLVAPGRTACLRCIDAYRCEDDPSWPLLVEQYARASARDRADGIPEPLDAPLAALAVAWAVRDLATYAEGGTPTTWSSTVRISADLGELETRTWPVHPHCGCTWR